LLSDLPKSGIAKHFEDLATTQPEVDCLIDLHGNKIKYGDMWETIKAMALHINNLGISSGDTILVSLPNSIDQAVLYLSALSSGINFAPIACTSTLSELNSVASALKPVHIFIENNLPLSRVRQFDSLGINISMLSFKYPLAWMEQANRKLDFVPGKLLITTSGSSGASKIVQLDSERLWNSAKNFNDLQKCHHKNLVYWNYLPMNYLGGLFNLLLIPIESGSTVLIDENFSGKTFLKYWHVVSEYGINAIWLVPSILRGLNQLSFSRGNISMKKLEKCFIGTAPVTELEKRKFLENFGSKPIESYGLTETTFIASETDEELDLSKNFSSVGQIVPGVEIALKPNTENPGDKTFSEIWVKSDYIMDGYFEDNSGRITLTTDDDGFFNTGDLGFLEDDQLILTGRNKEIIKKGGLFINLNEIEHIINSMKEVRIAAAVPEKHEFYGESYSVVVEIEDSSQLTSKDISEFLHNEISKTKWPETVIIVDHIPRTISGKIDKPKTHNVLRGHFSHG